MAGKAENISTATLCRKESERLILKIAHQKGWAWWYDNDGKLIVDVSDSTKGKT